MKVSYGLDGVAVRGEGMIGFAGALQRCEGDSSELEGGAIPPAYDIRVQKPGCEGGDVYDQQNCSSSSLGERFNLSPSITLLLRLRHCSSDCPIIPILLQRSGGLWQVGALEDFRSLCPEGHVYRRSRSCHATRRAGSRALRSHPGPVLRSRLQRWRHRFSLELHQAPWTVPRAAWALFQRDVPLLAKVLCPICRRFCCEMRVEL